MFKLTSLASGADFAKFDRYLREKVSETCFSRTMVTPTASSDVSSFFDFLAAYKVSSGAASKDGKPGSETKRTWANETESEPVTREEEVLPGDWRRGNARDRCMQAA